MARRCVIFGCWSPRGERDAAYCPEHRRRADAGLLWPAEPAAAKRLLNFFVLEKANYEIEYELAHRPDWLCVPLTGALRILSQQLEAP